MYWLWLVLFGCGVGIAGFAAAYAARKKPEMKLFGKPVQTERVMDVVFVVFLILANMLRGLLFPKYWDKNVGLDILAAVCIIVPAVLILIFGDQLILRKRFPVNEEDAGGIEKV